MKTQLILALFLVNILSFGQATPKPTLKEVLLNQLRTTHTKKEWFVPVNIALEDLTPEQAMWKDASGNHSIGQLANHLAFWNGRELAKFKGEKMDDFKGENEETFTAYDKNSWAATVKKVDAILTELEKEIEKADEEKLKSWYADIANISTHNAYHTGQIIYIRKMRGFWDDKKGVK